MAVKAVTKKKYIDRKSAENCRVVQGRRPGSMEYILRAAHPKAAPAAQ